MGKSGRLPGTPTARQGRGSVARPQVLRPQGESLLLAKDTRALPDMLPSRLGAGLFPQSRDRAGHTPFRQEELSCQRGILRDWRAGMALVVQRRGNHVATQGTQVPLAVGPPSPPTAGKMPQDATESRHSQTFKNRRMGMRPLVPAADTRAGPQPGAGAQKREEDRQGLFAFPPPAVAEKPHLLQNRARDGSAWCASWMQERKAGGVFKVKCYLQASLTNWMVQSFLIINSELSLIPSPKQSDKFQLPEPGLHKSS